MLVSSLRSLRLAYLLAGAALLGYAGCSSGSAATVSVTHPTMIEVAPASFLGDVPCATSGSGLKAYVATLYDTNQVGEGGAGGEPAFVDQPPAVGGVSGDLAQELAEADRLHQQDIVDKAKKRLRGDVPSDHFELPSSKPSPCNASVGFGYVVPERRYEVLIEGYEEEPDALIPQALGSHQMVLTGDPTTRAVSKWVAYCARAIPVDSTLVRADQCSPFFPLDSAAAPSLSVAVGQLLGSLSCGNGDGEVATFRVTATVGGATYEQTVDCSPDASVKLADLSQGSVSVYVAAFDASGSTTPLAGASCDATLLPAREVAARCNQLSALGTLRVDVNAVLAQQSLSCDPASVTSVEVTAGDVTTSLPPPDCRQTYERAFPPGDQFVSLIATPVDGEPIVLTCSADVLPGKLTVADCE
jgi:hypothetical protein